MDARASSTSIYIRNQLSFKSRTELNIYKLLAIEPVVMEVCNYKKDVSINIIGCIYKHLFINLNELSYSDFFRLFINYLKKTTVFLLVDCNTNWLGCDMHQPSSDILESLS